MVKERKWLIISECSKLVQKGHKTKYDWVDKVIHWESDNKFKFDQITKWYMYKPESVLENETRKILWDLEIQTDHLIQTRSPDLVIVNKKENLLNSWLAVLVHYWLKIKEREKRDKYLNLAREQKNYEIRRWRWYQLVKLKQSLSVW